MPKADFTADSLLAQLQPSARSAVQSQLAAQDARAPRRKPAKRAECPLAARTSEAVLAKEVTLHIRTYSLNQRDSHWRDRHRRMKAHRAAAYSALLANVPLPALPVKVTLTRHGKRKLDAFENLPGSMKGIVDGIADAYGIQDNDPRIKFVCGEQLIGDYAVDVKIERKESSTELSAVGTAAKRSKLRSSAETIAEACASTHRIARPGRYRRSAPTGALPRSKASSAPNFTGAARATARVGFAGPETAAIQTLGAAERLPAILGMEGGAR